MRHSGQIVGILRGASESTLDLVVPVIDGEIVTIGKYKGCALVVDHPVITELHARIYTICSDAHMTTAYIKDLSDNGTYINKRLIGRKRTAMLFSGCLIYFVQEEFRFYYISNNVLHKSPIDQTIDLLYIEKHHGPWDLIRLREQLHAGGTSIVFATVPHAIPYGTRYFQLACKRIKYYPHGIGIVGNEKGITSRARFMRELEVLKNSRHPCIPYLVDHCLLQDPDPKRVVWFYHLFTPLAYGGTLRRLIDYGTPKLGDEQEVRLVETVRFIAYQLLQGINYLHNLGKTPGKKSYIHADLKPENILIMEDTDRPYIQITDFGHAIPIGDALDEDMLQVSLAEDQGTFRYFSPERFKRPNNSDRILKAMDMWAIGVILYELITTQYPFTITYPFSDDVLKSRICDEAVTFPQQCWNGPYDEKDKEFVKRLLNRDYKQRPSADSLLFDPFVLPPDDRANIERMARAWQEYKEDEELYATKRPSEPYRPVDEAVTRELIDARDVKKCIKFTQPDGELRRQMNDGHFIEMTKMTAVDEERRIQPLHFENGYTLDPDQQLLFEQEKH